MEKCIKELYQISKEANKMDREIQMGDILNMLGQHLAEIIGNHPNDTFLYAEADEGFREAAIFHDEGDKVIYYNPSQELFDDIGRLWEVAEPDKKWAVMMYDVKDGKFDAKFVFPEDLDPEKSIVDRREDALIERYGNKDVIYPDIGNHFRNLTNDDFGANNRQLPPAK